MDIELSDEQREVIQLFHGGDNVFLTGEPGTGKSTVINHYKNQSNNVAYLSPTGIAALNIGGSTIHRFFKFQLGFINTNDIISKTLKPAVKDLINAVDTIVIDEISMVRADVLQAIDLTLRKAGNGGLPFGGKQMIFVGDFYQLPPVTQRDEDVHFQSVYGGPYAFNAPAWKNGNIKSYCLKKVHRQDGDPEFLSALQKVKIGDTSDLWMFNNRIGISDPMNGTVMCATNNMVKEINANKLDELSGRATIFKADIDGDIKPSDRPADTNLRLKLGAKVMMLVNDEDGRYVNGSTGTITTLKRKKICVDIDGGESGVEIDQRRWEVQEYILNEETERLEQRTVGTFSQYPIRLAYAMSIHKSQGQTLDSATIDLGWGAFAHGQTFVALSRVRSLDTLFLNNAINPKDIIVDPRVSQFMMECSGQDINAGRVL